MTFFKRLAFLILFILLLGSCVGQHNSAPNTGKNLDDDRIYGIGTTPRQLEMTYPEDTTGEVATRINKIREILYPK